MDKPLVNNGRLLQIIIALMSFIIGGGATAAVGYSQYTKLDTKIETVETDLRHEVREDQQALLLELRSMNKRLSNIEGRLDVGSN